MINLLLEGLETAFFPCSLVLLIPGLVTAITARQESAVALIGFAVAATVMSWLRFSGRVDSIPVAAIAIGFVVAAGLLVVPLVRRINLVSALGGASAGLASAALWEPCVGTEFGSLLSDLPDRGPSGLFLMAVYLLGVLAPLGIVGAVLHLIPNGLLLPVRPFMMLVGGATFGLLAIATAVGAIDGVISKLVELSV